MIKYKEYKQKYGRDPAIYLGIDENPIPKELVKCDILNSQGFYVFKTTNTRTEDTFPMLAFSNNNFYILGINKDNYLTAEDFKTSLIFLETCLGECSSPCSNC